jgi:DNA polymerase-3 subunit gamma/tau
VSGLSLAAIKAKRAQTALEKSKPEEKERLTKHFNSEDFERHLDRYIKELEASGQKILSSNFQLAKRSYDLESCTVQLEVPNDTIQRELQMAANDALSYLRNHLENDLITFSYVISKEAPVSEYAYTPEEKYQKLVSKYPDIEMLKKHFHLDL